MKEFFAAEGIDAWAELPSESLAVANEQRYRQIEERLGGVASAVLLCVPYYHGGAATDLSAYAQTKDYHAYFKALFSRLSAYLQEKDPTLKGEGYADASPLDEVTCALRAGLGVRGKNSLLLHPKYGSYCFLGAYFLSRAIAPQEACLPQSCQGCDACIHACPTGAITDPARRRCLSYLTQKKNLTEEEARLLAASSCRWGCDLCQSVCPYNRKLALTPVSYFREDRVENLSQWLLSPETDPHPRAFTWRGKEILKRNVKL